MGSHPINLAFRFLLELCVLISSAIWAWNYTEHWAKWILVSMVPITLMALWATFAVPNDPSRSGKAPVPVPGIIRLLLELLFFAFGAWTLFNLKHSSYGLFLGISVLVHYIISYDRIAWLLKK